ncbi:Hydrolase [Entamoeba marina]
MYSYTETTHEIENYTIFSRCYIVSNAIGNIICIPDCIEHSGIYLTSAKYFNSNNFNFYSLDLPGCGRSSGNPRGWISSFEIYIKIVHQYIQLVKQVDIISGELLKTFIIGNGCGGLICLNIASSSLLNNGIDGVIVVSPSFITINTMYEIVLYIIILIFVYFIPQTTIQIPKLTITNQINVNATRNDPYCNKQIMIKTILEIIKNSNLVMRKDVYIPLLLTHGKYDQINNQINCKTITHHLKHIQSRYSILSNESSNLFEGKNSLELHTTMLEWINDFL